MEPAMTAIIDIQIARKTFFCNVNNMQQRKMKLTAAITTAIYIGPIAATAL